jgi:ABC-2 type transport system ATP-binding protein
MSADVIVRVEHLRRGYGDVVAVSDLSFEVERGEMFGLIGPDGAGKTTTLRTVLGLLAPHGGSVLTCGLDPVRQHRALSHRVGYLSQRFSLYGDLTVDENIAFFAELHGVRAWRDKRTELLDLVRLTPFRDRLADRLSGGMRQKLALAATLIHTPEMLVLDEPTTGVDPVSRRDFWKLLARLQRDGLSILLTTPYLDEAERCGRVALLESGRLLGLDAPEALRAQAKGTLVEIVASPRRLAAEVLRALPEVSDVEVFGERLHATLFERRLGEPRECADALSARLRAAGVTVESARCTVPSLEDVFIREIRAALPEGERPDERLS